jgi:hypothetical protein
MLPALAPAQSEGEPAAPERATEVPSEGGFWPTPKMVERVIDRITEEGIGTYTFDEIQLDQTREILKRRVPQWMQENRAEIMTLMNQWFEALLDEEPPTAEDVAKWAERVLPVVQSFEQEVVGITDEMREFLNEDQVTVLEGELAAFHIGIQFATNKVRDWADGQFDPEVDWPGGSREDEADQAERDAEIAAARARENEIARREGRPLPFPEGGPVSAESPPVPVEPVPPAPTATPATPSAKPEKADEWTKYVDEFIRKYDLNDDQQSKARSALKTAQTNRDNYLKKKKTVRELAEIEKLATELKDATDEESRKKLTEVEERRRKLHEPVENEFNRLKRKLDDLPTREQRRRVKETEKPAEAKPETPPATQDAARETPEKP